MLSVGFPKKGCGAYCAHPTALFQSLRLGVFALTAISAVFIAVDEIKRHSPYFENLRQVSTIAAEHQERRDKAHRFNRAAEAYRLLDQQPEEVIQVILQYP